MKKIIKQKPQEEKSVDILKRVAKRVEEATVDISSMKHDLKFMNARLGIVEHNTEVMKVDMERMRNDVGEVKNKITTIKQDVKDIKRDVEGLTETTGFILKKAVTQEEHKALAQRITALEQS